MYTRAKSILALTASAFFALASQTFAADAPAPVHAAASAHHDQSDTIVYSATKSLIESVSELSKTATKLSETALKLLEAQESLDAKRAATSSSPSLPPTPVTIADSPTSSIVETETAVIPASSTDSLKSPYEGSVVYVSDEVSVRDSLPHDLWLFPRQQRDGGRYIWIPDENASEVQAILDGGSEMTLHDEIDLKELTYWRGDSIPLALPTKRLGRYDRKLYNWLIYPKGLWHISLTANYGELNTEDMEILTLVNDIDLKGKIYSIKPSVSYFLRNNLCAGVRLAFTKGDMAVNSLKMEIDEDMSFNLHDIRYTSDSYAAAVFLQQFFGLSRRGRFAVFNEVEMSVGQGNSHFIRPFDGEMRDTRTKTQSFNINYSPGVSIMMMKNAAFNLSFGIFGFHLKDEKQWDNGEESGSRFTSGINFRFNIFNINFGVSIII